MKFGLATSWTLDSIHVFFFSKTYVPVCEETQTSSPTSASALRGGPLVRIFDHCPSRRCVGVGGVSAASDRFYRFFGHGVKGDVEAFGFCFEKGFLWHF